MNDTFPIRTNTFPENPKVKICLRGLGVLCFSKDNNRAEIGYVDITKHDAKICMSDSKGNYLIHPSTSLRGSRLEITTPDKGMGKCYFKGQENENFDSMLDLSEVYGEEAEFNGDDRFQSKIFIDDAVFFTVPESIISVEPVNVDDHTSRLPRKTAGTGLWAYTGGENVAVSFNGKNIPLEAGETYEIRIWSNCPGDGESDFKYYYDILKNAGPIRYNLEEPGSGNGVWFTGSELLEFESITKKLNEFFAMKKMVTISEDFSTQEISGKLKYLTDILCVPKPCLFVTFADRSRNLPENKS